MLPSTCCHRAIPVASQDHTIIPTYLVHDRDLSDAMVSFTAAFVAATALIGAVAFPSDREDRSLRGLSKRTTRNGSGCSDGFWYQFCM